MGASLNLLAVLLSLLICRAELHTYIQTDRQTDGAYKISWMINDDMCTDYRGRQNNIRHDRGIRPHY